MMNAVEIQAHAKKLFDARGAKAIAEAAEKAKDYEQSGDGERARDWRRIAAALAQLRGPGVS